MHIGGMHAAVAVHRLTVPGGTGIVRACKRRQAGFDVRVVKRMAAQPALGQGHFLQAQVGEP